MKKKSLIIFLTFSLFAFSGFAAEKIEVSGLDFTAGLTFGYHKADVLLGAAEMENALLYPYAALEIKVGILSNISLGVVAGFRRDSFNDPVDFTNLPLSLRLDQTKSTAMVLGLNIQSEFFYFGDFAVSGRGEYLYFKGSSQEKPVDLAVVSGTATVENSFSQISVDLLLDYHGIDGVVLSVGPNFSLLNGDVKVAETIEGIQGEETLELKQKNTIGVTAAARFELGSHFEIVLSGNYLTRTSLFAGVYYVF